MATVHIHLHIESVSDLPEVGGGGCRGFKLELWSAQNLTICGSAEVPSEWVEMGSFAGSGSVCIASAARNSWLGNDRCLDT